MAMLHRRVAPQPVTLFQPQQREHRPLAHPTIPTIHLNRLDRPEEQRRLDSACRQWGFFQLADHGVSLAEQSTLLAAMNQLFSLPRAQKLRIERTAANPWGYFDRELTKNTPDWKQIFDVGRPEPEGPLAGAAPQWPALDGFQAIIEQHTQHCEAIARQLLQAFAVMLGDNSGTLAAAFPASHSSFLRLNYYPRCSQPQAPDGLQVATAGHLGINHHTDAGALTVLLQDEVASLQVYQDDTWHGIDPDPGKLIINIGDVLQVWSNDRYEAPLHRVLANQTLERFSAAYFFNPAAQASYAPLPQLTPPRYHPIHWGAFRTARAAGDYANEGEEIQIGHYRYPEYS